jgi:hypothetical protein
MAESALRVKYDGPALQDGSMPVRELAPSLLALGDLFTEASGTLYPDLPPVALNIKATEEGSFWVDLYLWAADSWEDARTLLSAPGASALANLQSYVIGGGVGVLWLRKRLKDRTVVKEEPAEDAPAPGYVRLTLDDGTKFNVPGIVVELEKRPTIRRSAQRVVQPLEREGVERIEFMRDGVEETVIEEADLSAYETPSEDGEVITDEEITMALVIVAAAFEPGYKWRFYDGHNRFSAAIDDEDFIRRIDQHKEVFAKDDVMRCRVRVIQTRDANGLHFERRILRVLQHIESPQQLAMDDQ